MKRSAKLYLIIVSVVGLGIFFILHLGSELPPPSAPISKDDAVIGLTIRTPGGATENLHSDVLIDAWGCATFLTNHRVTGPKIPGNSDKQIALFTLFAGGIRDNGPELSKQPGNTLRITLEWRQQVRSNRNLQLRHLRPFYLPLRPK